MRVTAASFLRTIQAMSSVMSYIDRHFGEDIRLRDLADVACMSPNHFDHVYRQKTRETPMATVRRLRLQRARRQIERGETSITSIAHDAGYGSLAAFTHAFVRTYGCSPSALPAPTTEAARPVPITLRRLSGLDVVCMPYSGAMHECHCVGKQLDVQAALARTPGWRQLRMFDAGTLYDTHAQDHIDMHVAIPVVQLRAALLHVDCMTLPAQDYAVITLVGRGMPALAQIHQRVRDEADAEPAEGRSFLRDLDVVRGYALPSEYRRELWLPVALSQRLTLATPTDFVVPRRPPRRAARSIA
ncbi:helix-turn-helix domain-containing protein [Uliginosibacterium sp. sgz301328]|uniref:helix-turn-helix domain-containing protein n=1 Tax=Uliginosibacterium sp. sgz301328 TaxID=3243764 RepID=UPI00359EE5D4